MKRRSAAEKTPEKPQKEGSDKYFRLLEESSDVPSLFMSPVEYCMVIESIRTTSTVDHILL